MTSAVTEVNVYIMSFSFKIMWYKHYRFLYLGKLEYGVDFQASQHAFNVIVICRRKMGIVLISDRFYMFFLILNPDTIPNIASILNNLHNSLLCQWGIEYDFTIWLSSLTPKKKNSVRSITLSWTLFYVLEHSKVCSLLFIDFSSTPTLTRSGMLPSLGQIDVFVN